ncbi:lachesin [Caerostris darwini]|uniref:Lachesin n=2 Tax=Caerostris TaxID=172845 RepID=A0AAV4WCY0_9ARAC|nr:lachesin [Caerostris extrusa]GIY80721.1 lachesin [Caerostris darwini]
MSEHVSSLQKTSRIICRNAWKYNFFWNPVARYLNGRVDKRKVAWIKVDTQTLLTLDTHVITRDRRLKITNSNKRQWFLTIKDVSVHDRGYYMCQINTEPMISQDGFLDVMVQLTNFQSELAFKSSKGRDGIETGSFELWHPSSRCRLIGDDAITAI